MRRIHFGFDFNRLVLSEKIYYGNRLGDLAAALHEGAHLLKDSKPSWPLEFRVGLARFLRLAERFSRSQVKKLIEEGEIRVENAAVRSAHYRGMLFFIM